MKINTTASCKTCGKTFTKWRTTDRYCSYQCKALEWTPIAPRSKKRAKQEREYAEKRATFLAQHPRCQVEGCQNPATEVHHKKGREGTLLTASKYFLATCRPCHQIIETNPAWARAKLYTLPRYSKR